MICPGSRARAAVPLHKGSYYSAYPLIYYLIVAMGAGDLVHHRQRSAAPDLNTLLPARVLQLCTPLRNTRCSYKVVVLDIAEQSTIKLLSAVYFPISLRIEVY